MDNSKFLFENTSAEINNAPVKAAPVGADKIGIWDSVTGLLKSLSWVNLLATAKAYFDTLYITTAFSPVPTRQTVLSGPQVLSGAAWVPNFLAATYPSLVVTTQNVSTGVNQLIATASNGDSDVKGRSTIDIAWPACTANQTNYLFCDVSGGVLTPVAPTILPPIEQDGGTPSVVLGQYTYNIKEHTQYLGNGTSAVQVNHVRFGEVVALLGQISSTVAYAYEGRYDSGYTATLPAAGVPVVLSSNIGTDALLSAPIFNIECTTANAGYSVGDEIMMPNNSTGQGYIWNTKLQTGFICNGGWYANNKASGTSTLLTNASWKWKMLTQRSWN